MIKLKDSKRLAAALKEQGKDYTHIATVLNEAGHRTKMGKAFNLSNVAYLLNPKSRRKTQRLVTREDQPCIKAIRALCDCDMSYDDKIAMIELALERGK